MRVEVGPKDVEKGSVAVARRDMPGRAGKSFVPQAGLVAHIEALMVDIQNGLYDRALRFREDRTADVTTYADLKVQIESGFARAYWAGDTADEKRVQDETKATIRCIPIDQPGTAGTCIYTGKETTQIEYKYALGSWDYVEKDGSCGEIGNRQLTLNYGSSGTQTVNDTVLNWRQIAPCGT